MITRYTVYHVDGTEVSGEVDWPKSPGFTRINELVRPLIGCENIEHVAVLHNGRRHDMFVDEMGQIINLQYNSKASIIYQANGKAMGRPHTTPIVGTAVLFDRVIWT